MAESSGLEKLTCDLEAAEEAMRAIETEVDALRFDPGDAASVEGAIQAMEALIDDRLPLSGSNAVNGPLRNDLKEKYRRRFLKAGGGGGG